MALRCLLTFWAGLMAVHGSGCDYGQLFDGESVPANQDGGKCVGGDGGESFHFHREFAVVTKIQVTTRSGGYSTINCLSVEYSDESKSCAGKCEKDDSCSNYVADSRSIEIRQGEFIKGDITISGNGEGDRLSYIRFEVQKKDGTSHEFEVGDSKKAKHYNFNGDGKFLNGFFGSKGADIDYLGFYLKEEDKRNPTCKVNDVTGHWQYVTLLASDNREFTFKRGTKKTHGESETQEWSDSASTTVEASLKIGSFFDVKGVKSDEHKTAIAKAYKDDFESYEEQAETVKFDASSSDKVLWQWVFNLTDDCDHKEDTLTMDYALTYNRMQEPCCVPGFPAEKGGMGQGSQKHMYLKCQDEMQIPGVRCPNATDPDDNSTHPDDNTTDPDDNSTDPTPSPTPSPTPPSPSGKCRGGSLLACAAGCPFDDMSVYEICVRVCKDQCPGEEEEQDEDGSDDTDDNSTDPDDNSTDPEDNSTDPEDNSTEPDANSTDPEEDGQPEEDEDDDELPEDDNTTTTTTEISTSEATTTTQETTTSTKQEITTIEEETTTTEAERTTTTEDTTTEAEATTTSAEEQTTTSELVTTTTAPETTTLSPSPPSPPYPGDEACLPCQTMCAPCQACADSQVGECAKCWHCWDWDDDELEDDDKDMDKDCDALDKDHDWDATEVRCLTNQLPSGGDGRRRFTQRLGALGGDGRRRMSPLPKHPLDCRACWSSAAPAMLFL